MPPCAAIEWARRGLSWNVNALTVVAELAERGGGRRAGEAGADDDDLEAAPVVRRHELHVELVLRPTSPRSAPRGSSSPAVDASLAWPPPTCGSSCRQRRGAVGLVDEVELHGQREAHVAERGSIAAKPLANQPRQRVEARVVPAEALEQAPGAVEQVDGQGDVGDDVEDGDRQAGSKLSTRLWYGSPRTKSGLAWPHVRSARWNTTNRATITPVQRIVRLAKLAAT